MGTDSNPVPKRVTSHQEAIEAGRWMAKTVTTKSGLLQVSDSLAEVAPGVTVEMALDDLEVLVMMVDELMSNWTVYNQLRGRELTPKQTKEAVRALIICSGRKNEFASQLEQMENKDVGLAFFLQILQQFNHIIRLVPRFVIEEVEESPTFSFVEEPEESEDAAVGPDPSTVSSQGIPVWAVPSDSDLAKTAYGSGDSDEAGKQAKLRRDRTSIDQMIDKMLRQVFGSDLQGEDVSETYPIMLEFRAWRDANPYATESDVLAKLLLILTFRSRHVYEESRHLQARILKMEQFKGLIGLRQQELEDLAAQVNKPKSVQVFDAARLRDLEGALRVINDALETHEESRGEYATPADANVVTVLVNFRGQVGREIRDLRKLDPDKTQTTSIPEGERQMSSAPENPTSLSQTPITRDDFWEEMNELVDRSPANLARAARGFMLMVEAGFGPVEDDLLAELGKAIANDQVNGFDRQKLVDAATLLREIVRKGEVPSDISDFMEHTATYLQELQVTEEELHSIGEAFVALINSVKNPANQDLLVSHLVGLVETQPSEIGPMLSGLLRDALAQLGMIKVEKTSTYDPFDTREPAIERERSEDAS